MGHASLCPPTEKRKQNYSEEALYYISCDLSMEWRILRDGKLRHVYSYLVGIPTGYDGLDKYLLLRKFV
jgi:hypothetical protein